MDSAMRSAALLAALLLLLASCAARGGSSASPTEVVIPSAEPVTEEGTDTPPLSVAETSSELPLFDDDASWGDPLAPVTIVAFLDLQCPFCARAHPKLKALMERYGSKRLRIVVKHNPLPFHKWAEAAAIDALRIRQVRGSDAFFRFTEEVFEQQSAISRSVDDDGNVGSPVLSNLAARFGVARTRGDDAVF
jgi:protein-disulfide isomerase